MAASRVACMGLNALYSTIYAPKQAMKSCLGAVAQVRSYYVDWRMLRDAKRRQMAFEYADERLRINALRKNTILPKELQEIADKEIAALPRDSCPVRIRNRCVLTSDLGSEEKMEAESYRLPPSSRPQSDVWNPEGTVVTVALLDSLDCVI